MSTMKGLKTHWGRGWGSGQGNRCRPLRLLMRTYGQSVVHPRRTQRVYSIIAGHKWRLGSAGIVFIVRTCETWKKSIMNAKEKAVWMNFFFFSCSVCSLPPLSHLSNPNRQRPFTSLLILSSALFIYFFTWTFFKPCSYRWQLSEGCKDNGEPCRLGSCCCSLTYTLCLHILPEKGTPARARATWPTSMCDTRFTVFFCASRPHKPPQIIKPANALLLAKASY